jgi:HEAT repeat protein
MSPFATRLLLTAALALGAGCGRGRVQVESVRVSQGALAGPLREAGLDGPALEEAARDALARAGFRVQADGKGAYRARMDVLAVRVVPTGGQARAEVAIALELSPLRQGDPMVAETAVGEAPLGGSPAEAWLRAVDAAAAAAAKGLAVAFAERRKGDAQLVEDLASRDGRVREHAVRTLGERGTRTAVPALVGRLQDEDPDVVQAAVGALAQIGDPRAVKPLIDLARRAEAPRTARLARIIGDIGGPEAEGYLLALESGHPDGRVRGAAREALSEMAARSDAASATR